MRTAVVVLCCGLALLSTSFAAQPKAEFVIGERWLDTSGQPIEAHGGGILEVDGTYYWFGENHSLGFGNKTGISVYSSRDLVQWKNEGVALPKTRVPADFRDNGVCERPKVIYNPATRKFVMWMHLDANDYTAASAGVAISDSPVGPFTFVRQLRPLTFDYGYKNDRSQQRERGNTFRDMNLFVDGDGAAYVFYASEDNATLYISRLNSEFTDIERPAIEGKTWARALVNQSREAPAPFKHAGKYYLFTSGTTGWSPNPADLAVAENILGPWTSLGNPAIGPEAGTTHRSQPTFVLPVKDRPGSFIYMGDRWNGSKLENSSYVWLPFTVSKDRPIHLHPVERWNLTIFDKAGLPELTAIDAIAQETPNEEPRLRWDKVAGADYYRIYRNSLLVATTVETSTLTPPQLAGRAFTYSVVGANIYGATSPMSRTVVVKSAEPHNVYLGDITPDYWKHGLGPLQRDKGVDGGPLKIAGKVFEKGIGTHAPSEIIYLLGGRYARFQAFVGVDNALKSEFPYKPSSVSFEVYTDGVLAFRTGTVVGDTPAQRVDISVQDVNELRLVVTDAGDGNHYDHADWADAKLTIK